MQTLHGTIVDVAGSGVLLRGPSGSGKSDLALRLIDRGATLVADDQFLTRSSRRGLAVYSPESLYGMLEVRGLGILSVPAIKSTILRLVVDIVGAGDIPRFPEQTFTNIEGEKIHTLRANAFEHSTPIKIELAVRDLKRIGNEGVSDG